MMQYTPSDILNYVYEKELDTQFLLAMANHVQDFPLGRLRIRRLRNVGKIFILFQRLIIWI